MDDEDWLAEVAAIAAAIPAASASTLELRDVAFGLWLAFAKAPNAVHREFERIPSFSSSIIRNIAEGIDRGESVALDSGTIASAAPQAAMLLRGLEQCLIGRGSFAVAPRHPSDLRVSWKEADGYLLPYKPRFRNPQKPWPAHFSRRGLRAIRFVPARLATGHTVELVVADIAAPDSTIRCAGCLFQKVVPLDDQGSPIDFDGPSFVFEGLRHDPAPDLEAVLRECFDTEGGCDVIAFPELSLTSADADRVRHLLQTKPWSEKLPGQVPFIVVPGTWHVRDAAGVRNRAVVFDGDGNRLGHHDKIMPYTEPKLEEGIVPGSHVLVVAAPNFSVAFGICLDFCQFRQTASPYDELDVDLIIIPSMGEEETMRSHTLRAEGFWLNRKTGTFVVQQRLKGEFGYIGANPHAQNVPFSIPAGKAVTHKELDPGS